jgi:very-short-patch-repair endonuclease
LSSFYAEMAQKLDKPPPVRAIAALAARQHELVTRVQLLELGLDDRAIARRVRAGRLHRVHRGVYAVGHPRLTREGRYLAAVFASGKGAVLSHRSAAVHWGLLPERGPRIDITVPGSGGRARRGATIVHRSPLPDADIIVKDGVPVTSPARTLSDVADLGNRRELERAYDEAAYLRLDLTDLEPRPGRRGSGLLKRVLAEHEPGSTRTRAEFEELLLALCREHDLPPPAVNATVLGHEVDFSWPAQQLIVETDGWQAHGTRKAFEADRERDAQLTAADWRVIRITWKRLEREPDAVAAQLKRLLAVAVKD